MTQRSFAGAPRHPTRVMSAIERVGDATEPQLRGPTSPDSALVLFPGAVGDFICFLPTLCALRAQHSGPMRLIAKAALLELVRLPGVGTASIDRREIADLFAAGPLHPETVTLCGGFASAYSWTGFGSPELTARLVSLGAQTVSVYPFRGLQPGEHAVDYYARCVGLPAPSLGSSLLVRDDQWLATFRQRHAPGDRPVAVLHPGSGSTRKNWRGFAALARHWRLQHTDALVVLRGPAEEDNTTAGGIDGIPVAGRSLPQVAALLAHSTLYVGNDSGISHLAGASGARGVVLFGPSDPAGWAPRGGALHVIHAPAPCPHCGPDVFCLHRLPVERVIEALETLRPI